MPDYPETPDKSSPTSTTETPKPSNLVSIASGEELDLLADAFSRCKALAESKKIIVEFLKEIKSLGLVGEKRNAAILFLAMVSRLLDKPVSVAVKGQSSAGKSQLVDKVLSFFPASSYYSSTALSDTALIHEEESLEHKVLVIHELAGVGDKDSKALYFLRQLMSSGSMTYRVAQEKAKGGHVTVKIDKKGPVAVITTTTLVNLLVDIETRFFSLSVDESLKQTRGIYHISGNDTKLPNLMWGELQNWLKLITTVRGPYKVNIPYRDALADLMPDNAAKIVRSRRDFENFLGLVKAHAVLHQFNREIREGWIQANFDDYEVPRIVIGENFAQSLGLFVPYHIRRIITAVGELCPNTVQWTTIVDIANYLNLDVATVRRNVRVAMKDNYLREVQEFRSSIDNRKLKIAVGQPMPNTIGVLPTRLTLEEYFKRYYL